MATSLYRKYRPQRFSELIGQDHVAKALQNAISENRLAHAYLLSGTRGTGKTSTARILGAVLNCELFKDGFPKESSEIEPCGQCESCLSSRAGKSFDVIELDAASNNGVDDMRELIEKVSYASAAGGTKVYIIDEVHELTGRAANALLKTLEEPPEHVVFILATTNPEKVLPTIRSRTQHFEFQVVSEEKLFELGKEILSWEEKQLDDAALSFVARKGAGSVRDMLSYLDQVLALEVTSLDQLEAAHASNDSPKILELILSCSSGDVGMAMSCLHEIAQNGKEPRAIIENIISIARDCLVVSLNPSTTILLSNVSDKDELKNIGDKCGINFLRQFILKLGKAVADMRGTATLSPLLNVEVALLSTMDSSGNESSQSGSRPASVSVSAEPDNRSFQNNAEAVSDASYYSERSQSSESKSGDEMRVPGTGSRSVFSAPDSSSQAEEKPTSQATLGALKKQAPESKAPAKKLTVKDVSASWPKVIDLLSVASKASIKKAQPIKLEGDVLTFGVDPTELDEVKARFKKDAALVRGFLEGIHETSFRFQLVPGDSIATPGSAVAKATDRSLHSNDEITSTSDKNPMRSIPEPDIDASSHSLQNEADDESIEKTMAESKEFDPVDTVVSVFGGEVVPE